MTERSAEFTPAPLAVGVCDRCKNGHHVACSMPITKGMCCCDD